MVEFLHHQQVGGKIPPYRIHLFWWNFPPSASRWKNLRQYGGIFPPSPGGWKNFTMPYPPLMVEFYHHLQGGGTIPPYHGKHLLTAVPSENTVEWYA